MTNATASFATVTSLDVRCVGTEKLWRELTYTTQVYSVRLT